MDFTQILIGLSVLIASLSVHEAAHAWAADRLGDPTARLLGRLSLNPAVHVDPIGTLLFPLVAMTTGLPLIGWAKPVPVNPRHLKSPRRDFALIAAAGPASNLVLALLCAGVLAVLPDIQPGDIAARATLTAPIQMLRLAVFLNVLLAVFNMLPVPPLDGGNVLIGVLPAAGAARRRAAPPVRLPDSVCFDADRGAAGHRDAHSILHPRLAAVTKQRVLSGMRPTGKLHLGHLVGALQNWVALQAKYDSFHCIVDWHALTTNYADTSDIVANTMDNVADWIGVGLDPEQSTFFIQSLVPEHAELYLLFQMVTPIPWLERVPTYKEQVEQLSDRDLSSIGFLGYPLLQAADIVVYDAHWVPVGEDQVPHIELTREVVRRFNNFYPSATLVEPQALADAHAASPGPRQPEDEQELQQHHRPVGRRQDGAGEGAADVHGPEARARRHPGDGRGQPRVPVSRRFQPGHRGSRGPQGAISRRGRSATSRSRPSWPWPSTPCWIRSANAARRRWPVRATCATSCSRARRRPGAWRTRPWSASARP